ncbi:hypothetical protein DVH24_022315 [Malus domestica]|uniref:Uncharacterized protein n=1 Tax=Malus domestica TaxID=3750 RepID=A0A498KLX8_MALDO|nr:hypothetical protein DVH24_022315 [Malus domestica]
MFSYCSNTGYGSCIVGNKFTTENTRIGRICRRSNNGDNKLLFKDEKQTLVWTSSISNLLQMRSWIFTKPAKAIVSKYSNSSCDAGASCITSFVLLLRLVHQTRHSSQNSDDDDTS